MTFQNHVLKFTAAASLLISTCASSATVNATALIQKAENQSRGNDFKSKMVIKVMRGDDIRTMEVRIWTLTTELAILKILNPVKDRFGGNLRENSSLWQYLPNVDRIIRIPASLMGQPWMGSDFTNDDVVRASSWSRDYTHEIIGEETINSVKTVKVECTPKKNAPVVWGKIIIYLRKADSVLVKQEFFNERLELVKYTVGSNFKTAGTHTIPSLLTMYTTKYPDHRTILEYKDFAFDSGIPKSTFTQEYLKKKIAN
jgi:outer membrane lipoprotein-sorting protein